MIHPHPTSVTSAVHLFHAREARPVQAPEPGIKLARVPAPTVWDLITENEITHAASPACLLTCLGRDRRAG